MPDTLDLGAAVLYDRWRRAVDLLWRETVRRRQADLEEKERLRADRRLRNLRRIVRRALDKYHRIEIERQKIPRPR